MSVSLRVLVPEATTNYVTNPALRYDTTGWTASGSSISRTLDRARFGPASLEVNTNGVSIREGVYYRVSALSGISDHITASVYVRGSGRIHLRLIDNPAGKEWVTQAIILNDDRWQRVEVTGFSTGSNDLSLYIETDDHAQDVVFYVDGAQLERKPYATTYCDGDQPGCRWDTIHHSSSSTRSAYTREGGKWEPLAGPCRENDDIYVTVIGGAGMAPIVASRQFYAINPGSFHQSDRIAQRVLTLSFFVKKKGLVFRGPNLSSLHRLRQQLIDLFKPDLTSGPQPSLLEFIAEDGRVPLYLWATYDGGLEGEWDIRNQWVNSIPLRLVADDSLFYEDTQDVIEIYFKRYLTQSVSSNHVGVVYRKEGIWALIPGFAIDTNENIQDAVEDEYGNVYFVGDFDTPSHVHSVAKWDGQTLHAMGTGTGSVLYPRRICLDDKGNVYVGGLFTSISGIAANRVAMWDGNSWSALGSGLNGNVSAMAFLNGSLYVSGNFTTAGGMSVGGFARWDGSSWHSLGVALSPACAAQDMIPLSDGFNIFCCGNGTSGSVMASGLALIDTRTNSVSPLTLPSGFGLNSYSATQDESGVFWLAGEDSDLHVGIGSDRPTKYDRSGISVSPTALGVGDGTSDRVAVWKHMIALTDRFAIFPKEEDVANSTKAPNICYVPGVAYVDRGKWIPPDLSFGMLNSISVRFFFPFATKDGTLYLSSLGSYANRGVEVSGYTDLDLNIDAPVWPILEISGPGRLRWIENVVTDCILGFNLLIFDGETVTIDFNTGTMTSSTRGDVSWGLMSARGLREFFLVPGNNRIVVFMYNENSNSKMRLRWTPRVWSANLVDKVMEVQ